MTDERSGGGTPTDWVALPGGELEGPRPRARCAGCRDRESAGEPQPALCFACYRAQRARERAIGEVLARAASPFASGGDPPVGGEVRGVVRHFCLPPSPADGDPRYVELARRRRQAQIAARRALAEPAIDLEQFPVSWRPFVRVALKG